MKENRLVHYIIAAVTVIVTVIFDQWTKYLAIISMHIFQIFLI